MLTSEELRELPPEDQYYDPERSPMRLDVLSGMSLDELFEDVTDLPDHEELEPRIDEPAWLQLPQYAISDELAAAQHADRDEPLPPATLGPLRFDLSLGRPGHHPRLRVTLTEPAHTPLVVAVRFRSGAQGVKTVLVPLIAHGHSQPNAFVVLDGFVVGDNWESTPPVAPADFPAWNAEVKIAESVAAAETDSTAQAWDEMKSQIPPELEEAVTEALRTHGHQR